MINFEERIGYHFKNRGLLERALTHSSYANEHGGKCNERLEFLGDSVLSIVISERLFGDLDTVDEGVLSKKRASLVCEGKLAALAKQIGLGEVLLLGKGEELSGGRERASVTSDAFEALIAAIYLDSNLETVRKWLLGIFENEITQIESSNGSIDDNKTALQEYVQGGIKLPISYRIVSECGEDHNKTFEVVVVIGNKEYERGIGSSKKDAEQQAAGKTLERLKR